MKLQKTGTSRTIVVTWNRIQSRVGITAGESRALLAVSFLLLSGVIVDRATQHFARARSPIELISAPPLSPVEVEASVNPVSADSSSADSSSADSVSADSSSVNPGPRVQRAININVAGVGELGTLPGIGPAIAGRIVDYRVRYGSFAASEELMAVRGIGPKTFAKLSDRISIDSN